MVVPVIENLVQFSMAFCHIEIGSQETDEEIIEEPDDNLIYINLVLLLKFVLPFLTPFNL